jgi:Zn-dependent protease/predicted transcriptional regulator
MRWSFRIATLFGIRIELHVTFLLFVGWIALRQWQLGGSLVQTLTAAALMLLVFTCVLLHELGHALTAARFGVRTRDIVLLPIGGIARLERMPRDPRQEILVAIAGPAVNVVIAAALFGLMAALSIPVDARDIGGGLLVTLLAINVAMFAFNLIPAFPMDGGRVLRAALALRMPYPRATRIASVVGQTIALVFGAVGIFAGNFMLAFIALFVFLAAAEERAMVDSRASLAGLPVRAAMLTQFDTLDARDSLERAVERLVAGSQQEFPVLENGAPIGVLTRPVLVAALREGPADRAVGQVVPRDGDFPDANDPLEDAVQRMRERGRHAMPVVSGGQLAGLLTLENVGELLVVRDAMRARRGAG